jgi:hypothetical protein
VILDLYSGLYEQALFEIKLGKLAALGSGRRSKSSHEEKRQRQ